MVAENPFSSSDDNNVVSEKPSIRSSSSKNKSMRVPKKIHKAEREKLKRDSLNVLFLKLSDALDATFDNNGKASLLNGATRALRDLLVEVECLRKENTTLLSESHYVYSEKKELVEENCVLQAQITELRREVQKRSHLETSRDHHFQSQHHHQIHEDCVGVALPTAEDTTSQQAAPVLAPAVFIVPIHHQDVQVFHESGAPVLIPKPSSSSIARPHARYPSDSWPLQILANQSEAATHEAAQF